MRCRADSRTPAKSLSLKPRKSGAIESGSLRLYARDLTPGLHAKKRAFPNRDPVAAAQRNTGEEQDLLVRTIDLQTVDVHSVARNVTLDRLHVEPGRAWTYEYEICEGVVVSCSPHLARSARNTWCRRVKV